MTQLLSDNKVSSMVISDHIPNGATATPVDDYTIWLRCAELPNIYGSLVNVIASADAMETLCNNLNALRYMRRSPSTILPAIYADSDWVAELKASTYAVKVPTMTSNTTPSGEVTVSGYYNGYLPWWAFALNIPHGANTYWLVLTATAWIQYEFTGSVWLFGAEFKSYSASEGPKTIKLQGSNNGTDYVDLTDADTVANNTDLQYFDAGLKTATQYSIIRLDISEGYDAGRIGCKYLQFYGLDLS